MRGLGPPGRQFIGNYCFTRVLLYAMMLKKKLKLRNIDFLSRFYCWCHFNWGGGGSGPPGIPLATPMFERWGRSTVPYGKSGRGYCITFIKSLDEDLR